MITKKLIFANISSRIQFTGIMIHLRSETYGSAGISSPPRSIIQVNGHDHARHVNGHNVVIVDAVAGIVEQSVVFRTDVDHTAGGRLLQFLRQIPSKLT